MEQDTAAAWMYVAGSFYIHFVVIGLSQSFGVLYVDLLEHFDTTRAETALVNSLLTSLQLLLGPISGILVSHFGSRKVTILCSALACCACVSSFFATSILYLCLSYGALLGITFSHLMLSAVVIVNQHFNKRRSLANSLGSLGGGVGTFVLPHLLQVLMSEYTWRGSILITGGIVLNCAVVGALNRPHESETLAGADVLESGRNGVCSVLKSAISVLRNRHYVIFVLSGTLGALAYLIPFNHIPDHARNLGIPTDDATWIISTIGFSGMFGRVFLGWVSDFNCVNRGFMFAVFSVVSGAAIATIPHLTTLWMLFVNAAVFGTFIGAWMSIQPVVVADIVGSENIGAGFGFLNGCQGITLFLGSPLAGWLYDITGNYVKSFYVAGGMFISGGVVMLAFGVVTLFWRQRKWEPVETELFRPGCCH